MGKKSPSVFFNASVILAGLRSKEGGSGKLLLYAKTGKIRAFASEIVISETKRNLSKLKVKKSALTAVEKSFNTLDAPEESEVRRYEDITLDIGDAHVLASSQSSRADYLVSLDKKHILALKEQVRRFKIVSPKELLEILSDKY